jgi:beta-barrel assembly-enhancing protease
VTSGWVNRLLSGLLLCAAASAAEPSIPKPGYTQFTDQDERKLGEILAPAFETRYPVLDNALLNAYVSVLAKQLGDRSRRPGLSYSVKVLNVSEVNSFSLPGGRIYLTRGALTLAQTESELAAVVAHEIGHIVGQHALSRFSLDLPSKALLASVTGTLPGLPADKLEQAFQALVAPLFQMLTRPYDRRNENEADLFALYNLIRSGWNPAGQVRWLERIEASGSNPDPMAAFRASHPDAGDRSHAVSAELKTAAPSASLSDDSLAFRTMKFGLDVLPKAMQGK